MYSLLFTIFLVIVLVWKTFKLIKNKKSIGKYENIDHELINRLNEGDQVV